MRERVERVVLLLRSLNDCRLDARTWSGSLVRRASRGEGPSVRMECSSCGGEGARRVRGMETPCEVCGARGWLVVDSYTLRPIGTVETGVQRNVRAVRCDACGGAGAFGNERRCPRCGGSGWVEISAGVLRTSVIGGALGSFAWGPGDAVVAALDEGFPGAGRAFRERVSAGSFEELEAGLVELRAASIHRWRLVIGVYVGAHCEPEDLVDMDRASLRAGLNFLEVRMPREIRVPSWAARNERRRRERLKGVRRGSEEAAA